MKALITAGGRGTRIQTLEKTSNKHLLRIAGNPVLFYAFNTLARAGIAQVGIAINPGDNEVKRVVESINRFGLDVTFIEAGPTLELPEIIGQSQGFIGNESFVFYLGDNLLENGIQCYINDYFLRGEPDCYLTLAKTDHLERYGVAEITQEKIFKIKEKPQKPKGDHAVTGISIYSPKIFDAIKQIGEKRLDKITISDMNQYLRDNGYRLAHSFVEGWWKDIGTPEDFLCVEQLLKSEATAHDVPKKANKSE